MAETKIAWCNYTFNPWRLPLMFLAPAKISFAGDRLEVQTLVTCLAERQTIANIVSKFRMISVSLDMVCLKIAPAVVAAMLAGVFVTLVNSLSPFDVFCRTPVGPVSLMLAVCVGVVRRSASRSCLCNQCDPGSCFRSVFLSQPIAWPTFCGLAHFAAGFLAHFRSFGNHANQYTFNPCQKVGQ